MREGVNTMDKKELRDRLKLKLAESPLDEPAVETVQPEIRTASQYAMLPSMRAGFRLDEPEE
ncbi:hypothetical protein [Actinoplanes sp. NPDC026623]|uniref:hypothetical protein n=1 Tax=Actinoplanes sp. NPDC026623 TaxID=3155610 RepID=UPI0033FE16F5